MEVLIKSPPFALGQVSDSQQGAILPARGHLESLETFFVTLEGYYWHLVDMMLIKQQKSCPFTSGFHTSRAAPSLQTTESQPWTQGFV